MEEGGTGSCSDGRGHSQFSSGTHSSRTLWDPMDLQHTRLPCPSPTQGACSNSGHWVSDAIQPSHPLLSPTPAFNRCQYQGLFKWVSSSHHVVKVLECQLQHQSFKTNIQDWFSLGLTGFISLQSKGLSRVFSNTTVQKHQFFGAQLSLSSSSHIQKWLLEKALLWLDGPLLVK